MYYTSVHSWVSVTQRGSDFWNFLDSCFNLNIINLYYSTLLRETPKVLYSGFGGG